MTKKDYELIARTLREAKTRNIIRDHPETLEELCKVFASELWYTNQRFDGDKFLSACGVAV